MTFAVTARQGQVFAVLATEQLAKAFLAFIAPRFLDRAGKLGLDDDTAVDGSPVLTERGDRRPLQSRRLGRSRTPVGADAGSLTPPRWHRQHRKRDYHR